MAQSQNPPLNFSGDGDADDTLEALRDSFDHTEPPLPLDEAAKVRIGKVISGALLNRNEPIDDGIRKPR